MLVLSWQYPMLMEKSFPFFLRMVQLKISRKRDYLMVLVGFMAPMDIGDIVVGEVKGEKEAPEGKKETQVQQVLPVLPVQLDQQVLPVLQASVLKVLKAPQAQLVLKEI
jgi:hypothetical protein